MKIHRMFWPLAIVLVACGVAPSTSGDTAAQQFELPTLPPDAEVYCSTVDVLNRSEVVLSVSDVVREDEPFISRAGTSFLVLRVKPGSTLARRRLPQGTPEGDDVDETMTSILVGPTFRPGTEEEALAQLIADPDAVVIVNLAEVATQQVRPRLVAAGHLDDDGRIELFGPCGRAMQPALDESAKQFDTNASAEWITRVADAESDEAVAALNIFAGLGQDDAVATFLDTPPADRDLTITYVPREVRRDYELAPYVLDVRAEAVGGIGIATSAGHSSIIDTAQGPETMNVLLVAPEVATVDIIYFDPSMKSTVLATVDAGLFDPTLGAIVTIGTSTDGQLTAEVTTMPAGDLEKRMGMTRDEIEAYRQQLYDR